MPDLNNQVLEFLKGLNRVVRSLRMYSATHPQVQKDMDTCFSIIEAVLAVQEGVNLGVGEGMLIVDGKPVKDASQSFKTFSDLLRGKHIGSIRIARGVKRQEFLELVRLLCMKSEEALLGDKVKPELLKGLERIKLNELRFAMLSGDEQVGVGGGGGGGGGEALPEGAREVALVLAESGTRTREDALKLLEGLFDKAQGGAGVAPGSPSGGVVEFLGSIRDKVASLDPQEAPRIVRRYFESLMLKNLAGKGTEEARESLQQITAGLAPDMQQMIFGEAAADGAPVDVFRLLRGLDAKLRSTPLVHDLLTGKVDYEQVRKAMDLIAPAPAEFVKLYEQVSAEVMETAKDPAQVSEALARLFKTLKIKAADAPPPTRLEGTVIVCDPEEIDSGGYPMDLEEMGFTVIRYMDGRKVWEHVRARGDVQCLIMDIKIPGKSGLDILNSLTEARRELPVIIVTAHAQFQDAFEVASYPRLRYFLKPVALDDLRHALSELIPQKPAAEAQDQDLPEEMKRAQEIQEKLIPTAPPTVPGYDIDFYYKPALAVGGDYVDFIPLDEFRTGMIVADVSGKNISGAMVMVMVRSILHMLARTCSSAAETVLAANEHISRDIRRGMFVSAIYAILDRRDHSLQVANCGHNPPLLWTRDVGLSQFLPMSGTAIGLFGGATFERSLREEYLTMQPGDRILFYTDGVVEAMDAKEQEFTEKQLLRLVNANGTKPSRELVQGLVKALERHRGGAKQSDDVTILSLARLAP